MAGTAADGTMVNSRAGGLVVASTVTETSASVTGRDEVLVRLASRIAIAVRFMALRVLLLASVTFHATTGSRYVPGTLGG